LELETLMRRVLGDDPHLEDQVQIIIRSVDADDSGTIDFDEFLTLMSDPKFNDLAKDEHRQAFEMFDKDGSGQISVAELKAAFRSLGRPLLSPSPTRDSHQAIHVCSRPKAG
jgi:calmodulin